MRACACVHTVPDDSACLIASISAAVMIPSLTHADTAHVANIGTAIEATSTPHIASSPRPPRLLVELGES